jgi:hypothetical protein
MQPNSRQLVHQANRQQPMQSLMVAMGVGLQHTAQQPKAQQGDHRAHRRLELQQMAQPSADGMAQRHKQILDGAAVSGPQATHRQHRRGRRQANCKQRREQQECQSRNHHGDQHAATAQPQPGHRHAADAAQVGLETGVEDQQRQADPMQGLQLQRTEGLGLGQPLAGNHQAKQQHGGSPRQAPVRRQAIHGQSRQVDQAKAQKETAGQQRALQMGVGQR